MFDEGRVGARVVGGEKFPNQFRVGGQAGEVEAEASGQGRFVGAGSGRHVFSGEAILDEGIDGVLGVGRGHGGANGCDVGPVFLVFGALGYPLAKGLFLLQGEFVCATRWGHDLILVLVEDTIDHFAFVGIVGDDRAYTVVVSDGVFSDIEAHTRFSGIFIETVAVEAILRKDGSNVTVEFDFGLRWTQVDG